MPILSSIAGAAAKAYGMMANAKRIITDTFNRANGSLGTSSSGHPWSVLRGTWSISSNQATSSDSGSTYPLATVDIGAQNVIVSADITDGGPGIAFWVTDANSWWASSVNYRSTSSCSGPGGTSTIGGATGDCGTYTGPTYSSSYCGTKIGSGDCNPSYTCGTKVGSGNCNPIYECGTKVGSGDCNPSTQYSCNCAYDQIIGGYCYVDGFVSCAATATTVYNGSLGTIPIGYGGTLVVSSYGGTTYAGSQLTQGFYSGSTVSTYYTELKLYKNISGTISDVATQQLNSNNSAYSKVNSIKATTSGDSITVNAYSNAGLSSQLGSSLTNTPSSPLKGTKAGIIKTSSDASSGSSIDNFAVENVL